MRQRLFDATWDPKRARRRCQFDGGRYERLMLSVWRCDGLDNGAAEWCPTKTIPVVSLRRYPLLYGRWAGDERHITTNYIYE